VGLVWSPLIPSAPRVATHLMHIQDWLPSLLHAVNATVPPHLDGHDLWTSILTGTWALSRALHYSFNDALSAAECIQGDSYLLLGFQWPIIFKPEKNKIKMYMEYESVAQLDL
jgi:hypothetical protein